jgi:nicotinamidase-related amidase
MNKSALIVLDMQPVLLPDDPLFVERVGQAIAQARSRSILVLYVVVGFRPGAPEMTLRTRQRYGHLNAADFQQIAPALAPQPGELTVVKRRASAFTGSDLEVVLRTAGVQHLILAGYATSGAVLSTVREAADKDYQLTVLADGCLDPDPEVHQVLTQKVFPRQAAVCTVADWKDTPH